MPEKKNKKSSSDYSTVEKDKKPKRFQKYGFPNIVRKKKLLSMKEIFDDVKGKGKPLFQKH